MEGFEKLEKEFDRFVAAVPHILARGVLAAYSGGMDSGVLLALLSSRGIRPLRAIHVVHNLRPKAELERELELVKAFCASLSVPLTVATIRPGRIEAHAREKSLSLEAAAREFRYAAFRSTARRFSLGCLCVAHNRDDSLETMLSRVMASSSLDGLGGIAPERLLAQGLFLLRPLGGISRTQIAGWAESRRIPVSEDSTNRSVQFQRNRLRLHLLPLLDREFPGWRKGLAGTMARLAEDRELVRDMLDHSMESCRFDRSSGSIRIDAGRYDAWGRALKARVLMRCLGLIRQNTAGPRSLPPSGARIPHKAVMEALRSLETGVQRCALLEFRLERRPGEIRILSALDFPLDHGYFLLIPGPGIHAAGNVRVTVEGCDGKPETTGPDGCLHAAAAGFLKADSFTFPLAVRSRKPGDCLETGGVTRRTDDLMKAAGIPPALRSRLPVIEDRRGIVAILGQALATDGTGYARFRDTVKNAADGLQSRRVGEGPCGFRIWIEGA
jgi:tRNA(Ile)-lysidine synthase